MGWSEDARKRVAAVLTSLAPDATDKQKRAALRDAYPWGPREYWPYKAWCAAVREALKTPEPPLIERLRKNRATLNPKNLRLLENLERQTAMKAAPKDSP